MCPAGRAADKPSLRPGGAYARPGAVVPRCLTGPGRLTHVSGMRGAGTARTARGEGRRVAAPWLPGLGCGLWLGCSPAPVIEAPASGPAPPARAAAEPAPAPAVALTPAPPGPRPISTPEIAEARMHAQRRMLGRQGSEPHRPREQPPPVPGQPPPAPPVPADSLGRFLLIEDPAPDRPALAGFHAALRGLQEGRDADGKVRVAMYGASGTAADIFTGYVRAYLQRRFGEGGPGFVPMVRMNGWYRHSEVTVESSKQWDKQSAVRKTRPPEEPRLGLMGVSFTTANKRAFARVIPGPGLHAATLTGELMFWQGPGGGRFRVRRGAANVEGSARAAAAGPGYLALAPGPGDAAIELTPRGDGAVRLYGLVLETDAPGVVVDTLGVEGARASNQLVWDEAVWADNLRRRAPDLVVLSYGTNESTDMDEPIEVYREGLTAVLTRHRRAVPEASCILLGPADYPAGEPRLTAIIAVQRELARAHGCGFWDAQWFMGGPGSMAAWVTSDPPLAQADGLHTTRRGAVHKGVAFVDALMFAYDAAGAAPETAVAPAGP